MLGLFSGWRSTVLDGFFFFGNMACHFHHVDIFIQRAILVTGIGRVLLLVDRLLGTDGISTCDFASPVIFSSPLQLCMGPVDASA
jgi:hypothetical protein